MSTSRSAPLLAAIGLAAVCGTAWLAITLLSSDPHEAAVDSSPSTRGDALAPSVAAGDAVPDGAGKGAAAERARGTRTGLASLDARASSGKPQIVEGRVSTPMTLPVDERALVLALSRAMSGRELHGSEGPALAAWRGEGGSEHPELLVVAEMDLEGSFRLELPAGVRRAHLALAGRYLYSNATVPVEVPQRGVVLAPELGARVTGRLAPPADQPAELEGVEVKLGPDLEDGFDALEMAARASGRRAEADAGGAFELRAVPTGGTQTVSVKPGSLAATVERGLKLQPGQHLELSLALVHGATLSGVVRDESGRPVANAKVGARLRGFLGRVLDDVREVESDDAGAFTLAAVTPGQLELHARADGYRDASTRLESALEDGAVRTGLELVLERGESIAGFVRYPDGSVAAGARVVATVALNAMAPMAGDMDREFLDTADGAGRFEISGLSGGRYRLAATLAMEEGEYVGRWKGRVDGVEVGRADVTLTLDAPIVLRGLVLAAPLAEPIESFEVVATLKGSGMMFGIGAERSSEHYSDRADGSFVLEGLREGAWEVRVRADGFGSSPTELVDLPLDENARPVEFLLPPAGMVAGRVVGPEGLPVARATVEPELDLAQRIEASEGVAVRSVMSDVEGRFLMEGLDPGTIQLVATRDGLAASAPTACEIVAGQLTSDVTLVLRRGGTLTGEVFDEEGRPDSGATVIVQRVPTYTSQHMLRSNTDGRFEVHHLEPGDWQIVRTMDLFGDDSDVFGSGDSDAMSDFLGNLDIEMVEIEEGGSTHVVLGAPPEDPVQLACTVVEAGEPVPRALVSMIPDGAKSMGALKLKVTDEEGRFDVELEHGGPYHFTVQTGEMGGAQQNSIEFFERVPEDVDAHDLTIELPGARVSGVVRMKGKGPLANCRVTLHVDDGVASDSFYGGHYSETQTDGEGRYEITHLRKGTYSIAVGGVPLGGLLGGDSEAGRSVTSGVRVGEGEWIQGVDFEVEPGAELTGVVRDMDGRPVEGAAVFVRDEEGRPLERFSLVKTDSAGGFRFKGISPGRYTVSARVGERASQEGAPVRVRVGDSEPAVVTLEPGTLLRIAVVDSEGSPLAARLTVTDREGRDYAGVMSMQEVVQGFTERSSIEERTVGPLPSGSFRVRAVHADGREVEKPVRLTGRPERRVVLVLR